jgi:hypothetical protein
MSKVKFHDRKGRCVAVMSVPLPSIDGCATVAGVGDDKADALSRAASVAHRIMEDPVMSALIPPQARAAIVAARGLAAAAQRGPRVLKSFWRRIKGPGKKRLAKALLDEAQTADVGWNPFKRKKKRKARPAARRMPPPRREPEPEPEEPAEESYDEGADEGGES